MNGKAALKILWITADGKPPAYLPSGYPDRLEYQAFFCEPVQLEERLGTPGEPVSAVVIGEGLLLPLRVARKAYQMAPMAHILFVVEPEKLHQLRGEMALAPMIGTQWTIVDTQPDAIAAALDSAVKANRQRRHLRTTLDSINLRLGSERPPRDSAEYRKLVISDKHLAAILEHAQDAIVSLDPQAGIASWNHGAVRLFGYSSEESQNVTLEQLAAIEQRQKVQEWFEAACDGTAIVQEEVDCRRNTGEIFIAEVTFAPIRDDVGEVIGVSLTAHDITARKRDEEELRRIRTDLEELVLSRTAALRSANRELEAFTYSASHDLRAPLRGIDGFSQALLEDYASNLDETAGRYVERIRAGARRMGEIIDSLLMLSKISQADLNLSSVDLSELTAQIVTELREREPERQVEVTIDPDLRVRADRQLIRIALENLLNNAWKFTRDREPALIEVGQVPDRREPTFFVRDNGAGFDMTYSDKLFVPFQRLHHPLHFEGSGIGLGTVQRVISRHHGTVWAQSVPEEGAAFFFSLPDRAAEPPLTEVRRSP